MNDDLAEHLSRIVVHGDPQGRTYRVAPRPEGSRAREIITPEQVAAMPAEIADIIRPLPPLLAPGSGERLREEALVARAGRRSLAEHGQAVEMAVDAWRRGRDYGDWLRCARAHRAGLVTHVEG